MQRLKIALDIDDTLAGFFESYKDFYQADKNPNVMKDENITRNVYKLRDNKDFWLGLPVIDTIDFEPHIYCTKRINNKNWTRKWLVNSEFPDKPIYQMYYQQGNKADMIKGRCDVLIDDSVSNVYKCINSGLPALLIDRPHNRDAGPMFRIHSLDYWEIEDAYHTMSMFNPEIFC